MLDEVYNQLFCLIVFIFTGIAIGILFDIFRILRKSFKTVDFITYLQDILFWVLAGCIMLFSIFTFNDGEIRSYVWIGIILGVIIYMLSISKLFVKLSVSIIKVIKKILSYPISIIKKIANITIVRPLVFLGNKGSNIVKGANKNLHNFTKRHNKDNKKHKKIKEKEGILQKM